MRMRRTKKGINVELVNKSTKVLEGRVLEKYISCYHSQWGEGEVKEGERGNIPIINDSLFATKFA